MINLFTTLSAPIEKYLAQADELVAPYASHALLATTANSPLLLVTTSTRLADELSKEITSLIGQDQVTNFPPWETLPHERLSPKADTVTARFKALDQITNNKIKIVVCSIRALLQPIIANDLDTSRIRITPGEQILMIDLITRLSQFGFTRADLVERRGDFAVRGGILDLFPADKEHPIRIDFFEDEIDNLSFFAISDQRSLTKIDDELIIYPLIIWFGKSEVLSNSEKRFNVPVPAAVKST
jgi:transcription-repair coupling factor (superfamily II helicase)